MEEERKKVVLVVRENHYNPMTNEGFDTPDTFRELEIGTIDSTQSIEGVRVQTEKTGSSAPLLYEHDVNNLLGKLLTLADATNPDAEHRKAVKDMMKQVVWDWHRTTSNLNHQFQINE